MSKILEANNLPLVTSLSDSDSILAVGSDGNGKRIQERHVGHPYLDKLYSTEEERWIRIAEIPGGTISLGEVFVSNSYYTACPRPIILSFCFSDSRWGNPQYSAVNLLCGTTTVFTKARLVHPNNAASVQPCYIEVYVSRKTERRIISGSIFLNNATLCNEEGSIPDGYLAKEFDLTESANRGGVNSCTSFAEWRKGGEGMSISKELTNDTLKEIMTDSVVSRGLITDFDSAEAKKSGTYRVENTTLNLPEGAYSWGILVTCVESPTRWVQRYYPHYGDIAVWIRVSFNGIQPWKALRLI